MAAMRILVSSLLPSNRKPNLRYPSTKARPFSPPGGIPLGTHPVVSVETRDRVPPCARASLGYPGEIPRASASCVAQIKARPFSTGAKASSGSESGQLPHWATDYRRRLGIGDSLVLRLPILQPVKDGEIKINIGAAGSIGTTQEGERVQFGSICAIASKSSGDVLGQMNGITKFKGVDMLELALYGLKAASTLAEEIKRNGLHDGPVVYELSNPLVIEYFHPDCECEPEYLRRNMPSDDELEEACRSCTISLKHLT